MKLEHLQGKRWLSLLLAASLLLGCLPLGGFAEEPASEPLAVEETVPETEAMEEPTETAPEATETTPEPTDATEETAPPTKEAAEPTEEAVEPTEEEPEALEAPQSLAGKTLSILGASMSTFAGTSNGSAADTTNSTIRNNVKYYPNTTIPEVTLTDTWWMQAASDLGLRLLVNNSWSGSSLLHERNGTVGAYVDRCVQLHDDTGSNAGEMPDIIAIQMGTNDFQYYKDTLGTADIDYAALIKANGDGSCTYAQPTTSLEAAAIVLHKISVRYPDAEVYYLNISQRIDGTDALIRSFNAELKQVVEHFGGHIVDIYGSAITMASFDTYIGDGKVHPNRLGMDAYTEAFKGSLLANTDYQVNAHTVTMKLEGVTADYGDDKIVVSGDAFSLNLRASDPMEVTVTMGGQDITASSYESGKVSIPAVTADVTVTAKAVHQPKTYRWEFDGEELSGSNTLTKFSGTTTDGVFSKTGYALAEEVILRHDQSWIVEWKCAGTFQNENGSSGARIFTSDKVNANYNARYIFKSNTNGLIAMGEKDTAGSHNYGIALGDHGIDWTAEHTYRLENRIAQDGTNMVYLLVDGRELGPMVNYYLGTKAQGTTSNWLSGKDFVFPFMGTDTHGFTNAAIDYIQVREGEEPTRELALRYDDHYDITGKTVQILDAGSPTSRQVGSGEQDTAVVTLDGSYLIATGIGSARVSLDGKLYAITVTAAPISLFMITGHSMGAGQNGSANQSVVGPAGQVYSSHGTANLAADTQGVGIGFAAPKRAANIDAFTEKGQGTIGEGSAFAWEWNRLTGEKVWVLNTAVGGSCLSQWIPGTAYYKNAVAQYQRAQAILENEIRAGHYTLNHMGILYHNGANFAYREVTYTQQDLQNWYDAMWNGFQSDLSRDLDGDGTQETVSSLGLVPIWTKSAGISYTQDEPAGLYMAASAEYPDVFTASVIGQDWLTNAQVAAKFPEITYTTHTGTAPERPDTTAEVFSSDNVHYRQVGYNAVGIDIAGNYAAYLKGSDAAPEIKLLEGTGTTEAAEEIVLNYGQILTLIPVVEPITATGLSFQVSGCVKREFPLQISATENGTGTLTVSRGNQVLKTVAFTCTDAPDTISLHYDDHYDITGKTVELLDAGKPTSYQVGYGVEENAVPDAAVVEIRDDFLVATGIGTAQVTIDGQLYEITVTAAPISLLLLVGQSNMRGSEGDAKQSIVCPEGMVYATYGDDRGESNTAMTVTNARHFAPSALTGPYSTVNVEGTTDCLEGYPVYSLTEAGAGKIGPDSGYAYEWVKATGEKVWIVNAAHGGTSINVWQPGTTEYEQCQALFTACQETLRKEIAAGHFTLNHMLYFWCQGCSDRAQSAQWYVTKYLTMHEGFLEELSFDHDSDPATPNKTFEMGGITPVRVGSTASCYRDGVSPYTNSYSYHESFVDLRFSGPRAAQFWMGNNPELTDIHLVCTIGDDWVWMPDGTNGVSAYFQSHYPGGTVDYTTQVAQKAAWYTPTTPKAVHDSIHYNQIGYNEVGREAVRNALILLGEKEAPPAETKVEFLTWDGITPAQEIKAWTSGCSGSLVVPVVRPLWRAKEVTYSVTEGLTYSYYDLLASDAQTMGTLTASTGDTVTVAKQDPGAYFAEHLSTLPESLCRGVNLWNVLEHDPQFYSNGINWGTHSSGNVYSVTIPVTPGDKIFATSFGKAGQNGHATSNGIRCTFFGEYAVVKTLDPGGTYAEFTKNGGYLVVPEGAVAMNIPMWSNADTNELYILNLPHDRTEGLCGICGKDSHVHSFGHWETAKLPSPEGPGTEIRKCSCGQSETRSVEGSWQKYALAEHMQPMPERYCAGTDLWDQLEHDPMYFASGTSWSKYSGGTVCSVTVPVKPGDRIFATSFGKAGENGHATADGIRTTFFGSYDVVKTMSPEETYAEFASNGGWLVAPEGAIAINVAMWSGGSENELYLLNAEHDYQAATDTILECSLCGSVTGGYRIEAPAKEVWIDGILHTSREDETGYYVLIEGTGARTLTVCGYNDASDPHTRYPTAMQVWLLDFENGGYVTTAMPELEDLLRYEGASIRVTGIKGIRMITGIDKALRASLMQGTLGYTLVEYGTAVTWAADGIPVLGKGYTMSNYAYRQGVADPIFADTGDVIQYTNVLVGFTDDQLGQDLIMRPYLILEDSNGERITLYGGCVQRSIGYIAWQNRDTFPQGSKAFQYIQDILAKLSQ